MAAIMYPPSQFQAALRHCTWLGLLGIVIFVTILVTGVDFSGKGLTLMLSLLPMLIWMFLWLIVSLRIR